MINQAVRLAAMSAILPTIAAWGFSPASVSTSQMVSVANVAAFSGAEAKTEKFERINISISGQARVVGNVLSAKAETFPSVGATFTYQWLRNGEPIKGSTAKEYRITKSDVGKRLSVRVTARYAGYSDATKTSNKTSKVSQTQASTMNPLSLNSSVTYWMTEMLVNPFIVSISPKAVTYHGCSSQGSSQDRVTTQKQGDYYITVTDDEFIPDTIWWSSKLPEELIITNGVVPVDIYLYRATQTDVDRVCGSGRFRIPTSK